MKNISSSFTHLTGKPAYHIFWKTYYACQVRLSTVMALHLDLEVIADEVGNMIAYRYIDGKRGYIDYVCAV